MNKNLARVTVVLTRPQADALRYVSERTGATQSAIVRDVFGDSVVELARAIRGVPDNASADDRQAYLFDLADVLETAANDVVVSLRKGPGHD